MSHINTFYHSPNCGRKFSVVSNLRRHFKVHQKQSLGPNKITSQERIHRVRQLIKKKSNDDGSTNVYQSSENKLSSNTIPVLNEMRSQHYHLLPPRLETNTVLEPNNVQKGSFQDITRNLVDTPLYYRLPYSWSEQSNIADPYNEEKTILLPETDNDVPSSVLTTFGEFGF